MHMLGPHAGEHVFQNFGQQPIARHGHQPAHGQQTVPAPPQGGRHRQGQRGQHGGVPQVGECAKPPQGRHVCMQAQLLRNAFVHPAPGARALPALGQLCHQRAPGQQGASGCGHAQQHHSGGAGCVKQMPHRRGAVAQGFQGPQGATAQQGARSHSQQPKGNGVAGNDGGEGVQVHGFKDLLGEESRCWDGLSLLTWQMHGSCVQPSEWPARAAFGSVVFYLSKGWPVAITGFSVAMRSAACRRTPTHQGAARWLRCSHCAVIIE